MLFNGDAVSGFRGDAVSASSENSSKFPLMFFLHFVAEFSMVIGSVHSSSSATLMQSVHMV